MPNEHHRKSFSWVEQGEGRPIVFLHPIVGTRQYWDPQLAGLSDQFRCIALDAPGYDGQPSDPLTPTEIGTRIIEFLDALEMPLVDLVGLSLGAMHALYALGVAPERIGRVVLADTSLAFGANPIEWLTEWHDLEVAMMRRELGQGGPGDQATHWRDGGFFALLRKPRSDG